MRPLATCSCLWETPGAHLAELPHPTPSKQVDANIDILGSKLRTQSSTQVSLFSFKYFQSYRTEK